MVDDVFIEPVAVRHVVRVLEGDFPLVEGPPLATGGGRVEVGRGVMTVGLCERRKKRALEGGGIKDLMLSQMDANKKRKETQAMQVQRVQKRKTKNKTKEKEDKARHPVRWTGAGSWGCL